MDKECTKNRRIIFSRENEKLNKKGKGKVSTVKSTYTAVTT
jgi:hypothetical protein